MNELFGYPVVRTDEPTHVPPELAGAWTSQPISAFEEGGMPSETFAELCALAQQKADEAIYAFMDDAILSGVGLPRYFPVMDVQKAFDLAASKVVQGVEK